MINGLEMVTLRNYLLTRDEIELLRTQRKNNAGFRMDVFVGNLVRYKGEFVAYCNGNLCGHCDGEFGRRLFDTAVQTYGSEREINVYQVPNLGESLESAVNNALRSNKKV